MIHSQRKPRRILLGDKIVDGAYLGIKSRTMLLKLTNGVVRPETRVLDVFFILFGLGSYYYLLFLLFGALYCIFCEVVAFTLPPVPVNLELFDLPFIFAEVAIPTVLADDEFSFTALEGWVEAF